MKKILAPTDFSNSAQNSVIYATQLAKQTSAKLILFHAYNITPIPLDVPLYELSLEEYNRQSMVSLQNIKDNLMSEYGEMDIECTCKLGFAVDAIHDYALENDIDMIVMGIHGKGLASELLFGSITTSLMKNSPCPVLVIGSDMQYHPIKNIAWACDAIKPPSEFVLHQVQNFFKIFTNSRIFVINVVPKYLDDKTMFEKHVLPIIKIFLWKENYSVHKIESEGTVEGINEFVKKKCVDLVIMSPRRHAIWRKLFFEPDTKRMSFHAEAPLLLIHQ